MTVPGNSMQSAIDDARALLDTLLTSGWQDIHVVSGESEIFIARDAGRPNPMRRALGSATPSTTSHATDQARDHGQAITAPHVATIVNVLAVGTQVESGAWVATIRVLDVEEVVPAPHAGTVTAIHADTGSLVEFKAPILSLGVSGR